MPRQQEGRIRTVRVGDTRVITRVGGRGGMRDPYHLVLTLSWPRFFAALLLVFTLINLLFGTVYWLLPGSVTNVPSGDYIDYVFFSIETLATVGYGVMAPASFPAHVVASVEILCGMIGVALTTGLVFARFSKPTARMLFSQRAVIREFDGARVLMVRVANERYNRIVEATAHVSLVRTELTSQGEHFVRIHDLLLKRQSTPVFALTWTLMHVIDETSPLHAVTPAQLAESRSRVVISVAGHDETMAASVHAHHSYDAEDVAFDSRFVDVLHATPTGERIVDLTKFHDIERA